MTREIFFRFSPEALHSDQGRQFDGLLLKEICQILQIKKSRTSPYHPQFDGLVERLNCTLLSMLATSAKDNPLKWEEYLQPICFAYNAGIHSSTGFTPFYLMYGREARFPVDLHFGINSLNSEDLSYVTQQAKTDLTTFLTRMELLVSCYSPYLALSSGACGASIRASAPEL